jgi:ribose/xylose/arabinose/galactoside ABC-type transport system permease subunit
MSMPVDSSNIKTDKRKVELGKLSTIVNMLGVYGIVILIIILGAFISDKFLTMSNFRNIIEAVTLLGIVSVGVAFVTYSGHYADLSVPTIIAFAGVVAVDTLQNGIIVSIIAGMLAGVAVGVVNGFVVGKLRANPIIWTLAVAFVLNGFLRWIYSGSQIYPDVKAGEEVAAAFINLSRTNVLGIPIMVWILIILVIVCQILLTRTKFGQQLKLIGASYEVAKMTGVNVTRTVGIAFVLSALTASIAGILLTSLVKIGAYYNGAGYDFRAVTAIVIGGVTLAGGRGNIIGVIGGVIVIGLMNNMMTLIGIGTFSQTVVQGIVFILVVWINANSLRKLGKDDA